MCYINNFSLNIKIPNFGYDKFYIEIVTITSDQLNL